MRGRLSVLLLMICLAGFVAGLWHLLRLRFEAGDVYPAYSSLRADPLGTMALYESLRRLPGISVERDYSALGRLPDGRGCAYLHLAAQRREWIFLPEEVVKEVEGFMARGGRLVVAFLPVAHGMTETLASEEKRDAKNQPANKPEPSRKSKKKGNKNPQRPPESPNSDEFMPRINVKDRWHFELGLIPLNTPEGQSPQPARVVNRSDVPLPETLAWHSGLILTNVDSRWETIYARGKHPVVARRKFGAGSMIVATDCFFLSNEALRNERYPELLSWFLGSASHVVFDEAHLGITEGTGVAALIKHYRLVWVAGVLAVLALLFIWKDSASFIPMPESARGEEQVAGKEAASGFVSLLRRNIGKHDVVPACYHEWRRWALLRKDPYLAARAGEADALLAKEKMAPALTHNPLDFYGTLGRILYPPKKKPPITKA